MKQRKWLVAVIFLAVVSIVIIIFQVAGNTDRLDLVSIGVVGVAVITL